MSITHPASLMLREERIVTPGDLVGIPMLSGGTRGAAPSTRRGRAPPLRFGSFGRADLAGFCGAMKAQQPDKSRNYGAGVGQTRWMEQLRSYRMGMYLPN